MGQDNHFFGLSGGLSGRFVWAKRHYPRPKAFIHSGGLGCTGHNSYPEVTRALPAPSITAVIDGNSNGNGNGNGNGKGKGNGNGKGKGKGKA
jgi:hypothetical protein